VRENPGHCCCYSEVRGVASTEEELDRARAEVEAAGFADPAAGRDRERTGAEGRRRCRAA